MTRQVGKRRLPFDQLEALYPDVETLEELAEVLGVKRGTVAGWRLNGIRCGESGYRRGTRGLRTWRLAWSGR